jgi:transposase InsO family protein
MTYQDYLEKIYYDPQHPGSFSGVDKLYNAVRQEGKYVLGKAKISKWLEAQETFGLHRQINRKIRRRKVIAPFIGYQWDADTAVMKSFAKDNDGYAYFVVAIDVFSRFSHTFPLRSTQGKEMSSALQTLFRRGKKPTKLRTDKGVEFLNRDVQRLLKAERVNHFYTQNEQKSSYAERCIKTLKAKLFCYLSRHQTHRWIDVLDEVTQSYNGGYHRSIKMAPRAVTKKDEARLWKLQYTTRQYAKTPIRRYAFQKGDTVRILHVRQPFDREYDERWTMEYFVADHRGMKEGIPHYTLKYTSGDAVQGTVYQPELNRVKVTEKMVYRIEKVIRRRRNEAMVKWMG